MNEELDPVLRPDRACAAVGVEVFFPPATRPVAVKRAVEICAGCPVLAQCAAWAAPLVAAHQLTDCVVGAVRVPSATTRRHEKFANAAAALAEVALLGHVTGEREAA